MAAPCPVHYSGAPLAVDFGEQENTPVVCVVEAAPGTPAARDRRPDHRPGGGCARCAAPSRSCRRSPTTVGDDYLRVWVREPARAGLREEVTALLPNALEVRIDPEFAAPVTASRPSGRSRGAQPVELFGEYLGTRGVDDPRVEELFRAAARRVTGSG